MKDSRVLISGQDPHTWKWELIIPILRVRLITLIPAILSSVVLVSFNYVVQVCSSVLFWSDLWSLLLYCDVCGVPTNLLPCTVAVAVSASAGGDQLPPLCEAGALLLQAQCKPLLPCWPDSWPGPNVRSNSPAFLWLPSWCSWGNSAHFSFTYILFKYILSIMNKIYSLESVYIL